MNQNNLQNGMPVTPPSQNAASVTQTSGAAAPQEQTVFPNQQPQNPNTGQQLPYQQPQVPNAGQSPQNGQPANPYVEPQQQYHPPVNPYVNTAAKSRPVKTAFRSGRPRDTAAAVLIAVLSFIMIDCILWADTLGFGFSVCAVALSATVVWYLRPVWRHTGVYTAACLLLFATGSVSLIFSADTFIKFLTMLCLIILYACFLMDGMQLRKTTPGTFRSVGDFFYTVFGTSFGKIGRGMYGLFHREKNPSGKSKAGVGKALLGLLIALPVAAILIVLLSSADEAFHGMLEGIDLDSFPEKIASLLWAIPLFILLFCQLFSLQDIKRERKQESEKGFDPIILTFFLLGISVVYVAYLFSQLAYFFSGFSGFLPEEFTYAEYARRGFFELGVVSFINIVIVILSIALSKKSAGKLPVSVKLPSLFLCLFSLVLVGTEIAKMKMYMDSYGLTRLRILTTLFMVFLAVVFLSLIVAVFVRRFPYMKIAVVCGAALVIALNLVSVDRLVAEYNVGAYQSGVLETVDVKTVTQLGDAAVPALIELAQDDDAEVAAEAKSDLYIRWKSLHQYGDMFQTRIVDIEAYDWRGFNTVSYQARQLLLDNEKLFTDNSSANGS